MYAILGVGCSLVAAILFTRWLRKTDTKDFDEDRASVSSEEVVSTDADDVSESPSPVADSAGMEPESFTVSAVAECIRISTICSAPLQVTAPRFTRSVFMNRDAPTFTAEPVFCAQPEPEIRYKIRATLDSVFVGNFSVSCKADSAPQEIISEEFKSPTKGLRSDAPSPRRSHQVSKRSTAASEAEEETEEWPEDNVTVTPSKSTNRFRTAATPTRLIPIACLANFHPVDGILQGIELISPSRAPVLAPESIRTPPNNRRALGSLTNQSPNIRSPFNVDYKSPDANVMSSPAQGAKRVTRVSRRTG